MISLLDDDDDRSCELFVDSSCPSRADPLDVLCDARNFGKRWVSAA
jgi:hypothetical protein